MVFHSGMSHSSGVVLERVGGIEGRVLGGEMVRVEGWVGGWEILCSVCYVVLSLVVQASVT